MDVVVDTSPKAADKDAIRTALIAYNLSRTELRGEHRELAVLLRNPQSGATEGGLCAESLYGWLYVKQLFVPESLRGQGFGNVLIERAEGYARESGLTGIWLDTFSFQAPGFYEKRGFSRFGTLDNYPVGSKRHYFCKYLTAH